MTAFNCGGLCRSGSRLAQVKERDETVVAAAYKGIAALRVPLEAKHRRGRSKREVRCVGIRNVPDIRVERHWGLW